jgi:hypothetical protein
MPREITDHNAVLNAIGKLDVISELLEDAADESGNQIAVFGRRGARPFTLEEVQRLFRTEGGKGKFFTVTDKPRTAPCNPCSTFQ